MIDDPKDIFTMQAVLNHRKRILNLQVHQTAEEWLQLAREYQEIDSRANFAYCTKKAQYYGAKIERNQDHGTMTVNIPEPDVPEYDWQTRADVGD